MIRIAVPYRSDGRGKGHDNDLCLLERGELWTGEGSYRASNDRGPRFVTVGSQQCAIHAVTLISRHLYDASHTSDGALPNNWQGVTASPIYCEAIDAALIDGLFVPGGPTAHPSQEGGRNKEKVNKPWETARHAQEEDAIRYCRDQNIPVFAICGGSWRLAAVLGAQIVGFGPSSGDMRTHNKPFNAEALLVSAHDVSIESNTHLRQLFDSDYRGYLATKERGPQESVLNISVNSSHWAKSVFDRDETATRVSALSGNVAEGYEDQGKHFCIGVQWHPEYAQVRLMRGDEDESAPHKLLMENFMRATAARHAAVTIQRAVREWLKVQATQSSSQATGGVVLEQL
nr:gamma-glutamyl-gamma-aminobutyrate hydrolase family protein [Dyella mobilis]